MRPTMTRQITAIGMALTVCAATSARAQGPAGQLTPQTEVKLQLVDRLRSGSSKVGDRINFRVDADVKDTLGNILIRSGTPAYGTVTRSRGGGILGKGGKLEFSIDYTTAVDAQRVPLRGNTDKSGGGRGGTVIGMSLLLNPLFGLMHGKNVTVEPGVSLVTFVDGTLTIQPSSGAAGEANPVTTAAPAGPAKCLLLRNGDRITGSLESLANGVYTITTASGTLRVPAAEVQEIRDAAVAPGPASRPAPTRRAGR